MHLHTISALTLSAVAAVSASSEPAKAPIVDDYFPAASGALEITLDAEGNGPSYLEFVSDYAELTGQFVTFSKETRQTLAETEVQLSRSMSVGAEGVQHITEVLLSQAGLHLAIESTGGPQVIRIRDAATEGMDLRSTATHIDIEGLEIARKHPAMTFSVVVPLGTSDARLLSNSCRTLITDAHTMHMIPAGTNSALLVTGCGDWVYETAQRLLAFEEQAKIQRALSEKKRAAEAEAAEQKAAK